MKRPPNCKARQQSDEIACAKCGLRWEANDPDPPKCNVQRSARVILEKINRRAKHV